MFYDDIRYEFRYNSEVVDPPPDWTDISSYVVGMDKGRMGMMGVGPLDRVAGTGSFKFSLRNVNNAFSPGHIDCTSGFQTGMEFRLVIELDGDSRTRFYGKVPADGIEVTVSEWHSVITVTVLDYMEMLAIHELDLPTFAEDKRIDEIVLLIIANMPIAPLATDYNTGQDTFATVFDTVKSRTRALQEIAKVCNSELGYVYVVQSDSDDEVLVVEGRQSRSGATISAAATLENCFLDHKITHGEQYFNAVKVTAHPRRVDAAATSVLFTLDRVISIAAGESETIKGSFKDPDQEAVNVAGIDMVTPVATTDYLMNAAEDGGGADLTADLDVTATYGANGVEYELENTGASLGYVTLLQARGKGVYTYRPVDFEEEYSTGINADGKRTLNLDLFYQDNPLVAKDFCGVLLDLYSTKRTDVKSISMLANTSETLMEAFVDCQIGDVVHAVIDDADIEGDYFIHAIDFSIAPHGIVVFSYSLFPAALAPGAGFWLIGEVGYSEIGETTKLGF